jgi:hypothetical protein
MRDFRFSFLVSAICLGAAGWWGHHSGMGIWPALWLTLVLGVLEVSLSFDNAVVNAGVLKTMSPLWQKLFLTVGIFVAVFGMRLLFPIVIVAIATDMRIGPVVKLALDEPGKYSQALTDHYASIAAFGGMFLLLVFLRFLFDRKRKSHWLGTIERLLGALGKADAMAVIVAIASLMGTKFFLPPDVFDDVLFAGLGGILLFLLVDSIDALFSGRGTGGGPVKRSGAAAFVYLEVLDASFSFDGVIGAFAITRDVVIIMLGLAIGAMFVRSLTVHLVHRGTLDRFVYLEHGAHYAIGALAVIMLVGTVHHVPEVVTGLIGVGFIVASLWSSIRHRRHASAAIEPATLL